MDEFTFLLGHGWAWKSDSLGIEKVGRKWKVVGSTD